MGFRYFLKPVQNRFRFHQAIRTAFVSADGCLNGIDFLVAGIRLFGMPHPR